jgi:hypothetical protein
VGYPQQLSNADMAVEKAANFLAQRRYRRLKRVGPLTRTIAGVNNAMPGLIG